MRRLVECIVIGKTLSHEPAWEVHGGKVEKNESPYRAAMRESDEELGVKTAELSKTR